MKLEVGKRYVLRNGEVVGPLTDYGGGEFCFTDQNAKDNFGRQFSWRIDGSERLDRHQSRYDIVSEQIEPSTKPSSEPLRWVENTKPDKPGIWAIRRSDGSAAICDWTEDEVKQQGTTNTRCYIGPIPEILPPKKKVVQRLWLDKLSTSTADGLTKTTYQEIWLNDDCEIDNPCRLIRTDETREVEQ